jgi:hypothetical protein
MRSNGKSNRAPGGLGSNRKGGSLPFPGRRTGLIQALSRSAVRFSSIAIASLQRARRFGAAGLFLLGSVALAGNDSSMLARSFSINGMKTGYALSRGATSFIIRLAGRAQDRSFTFVNENAAAEGRLLIAVSNQPLAVDSPMWSAVEGAIRFRHKRLFTLSLVGVEANYVRLTFQVDVPEGNARNDFSVDHPRREDAGMLGASALLRGILATGRSSTPPTRRP